MSDYYVEFLGELKDNVLIVARFVDHYNKVCDIVNARIPVWNREFDEQWKGEPITDYSENEEYNDWILKKHRETLINEKLDRDILLDYYYDDELQLCAIGRIGDIQGKKLSFVIWEG